MTDATLWTAFALKKADITPPDFFLANQVASRQAITMIAGRRGVGKTYITLSLAQKMALGEQFGMYATKQGRVLYVSQEMSEASIHRRLENLFGDAELEQVGDSFQISCQVKGIKLDTKEGANKMQDLVWQAQADVVFVDALRDIKGVLDENSNTEMGDLMCRLRDDVAVATNSAVILIHHMGKPSQDGQQRGGRGASAIEDTAADIIYLSRRGDFRVGVFEKTRDGDIEGDEFTVEFKHELGKTLELAITEGTPPEESAQDKKMKEATEFLRKEGGSFQRKALREALGWSDRTMSAVISKAVEKGLWESSGGGRGNPQVVSVVVEPPL